jgi:DNA anti-recombination protein RmuC
VLIDWFRTVEMKAPMQVATDPADRNDRKAVPPNPETLEEIYAGATVKPLKIAYGIQKVAEMASSTHLAGMSPDFKRRALLMALSAADTDEGEVLNDLVVRQRAIKEYEDSYLERLNQYEAAQLEQNRLHQAELDRITSQFKARIQANLDDVERRHREFRAGQETRRQEMHRFTETAALCVPQQSEKAEESEEAEEAASNVMPILRAAGASR